MGISITSMPIAAASRPFLPRGKNLALYVGRGLGLGLQRLLVFWFLFSKFEMNFWISISICITYNYEGKVVGHIR